jgi:hypothetical protein
MGWGRKHRGNFRKYLIELVCSCVTWGTWCVVLVDMMICPSRLIGTYSLIWLASLLPEHKITLLMQCVELITDVGISSGISFISDVMP